MGSPSKFTTDANGNVAVRVTSVSTETNSPSMFTTDADGNCAVRVVGAGGGVGGSYVPQWAEIPTAGASYLNQIVEYKGATTSDYTNGFFYKCNGSVVYSASVAFADNKISVSDANYLSFLQDAFPTKFMNIVNGKMIYHEAAMLWSFVGYDADGNNITRHWNGAAWIEYQLYTDDWEELGFSFNYEAQDLDEVAFTNTITIVSESYSWGRINVQPLDLTQVSGYDATRTQTLKHDTTGLKWVND